jgi:hypothetical protein
MGAKHGFDKPVNAAAAISTILATAFVWCGKPMIRLHSFWTPRQPLSKSVPLEGLARFADPPVNFTIG